MLCLLSFLSIRTSAFLNLHDAHTTDSKLVLEWTSSGEYSDVTVTLNIPGEWPQLLGSVPDSGRTEVDLSSIRVPQSGSYPVGLIFSPEITSNTIEVVLAKNDPPTVVCETASTQIVLLELHMPISATQVPGFSNLVESELAWSIGALPSCVTVQSISPLDHDLISLTLIVLSNVNIGQKYPILLPKLKRGLAVSRVTAVNELSYDGQEPSVPKTSGPNTTLLAVIAGAAAALIVVPLAILFIRSQRRTKKPAKKEVDEESIPLSRKRSQSPSKDGPRVVKIKARITPMVYLHNGGDERLPATFPESELELDAIGENDDAPVAVSLPPRQKFRDNRNSVPEVMDMKEPSLTYGPPDDKSTSSSNWTVN